MGIHYQAFNCKFIIFFIIFSILSFAGLRQSYADDELFTVENIKVDITADNSVLAQNQAFEEAQSKAFEVLANRMVDEAQVQAVATPNSLTISSLVKDYEVTDEKISAVRYVGTYIFRFRGKAVSKFFAVSGVTYTDKSSDPLLVLPVLQKNGKNILWSDDNIWMQAWGRSQNLDRIVPIEIPIGDLMDIADTNENNVLNYDRFKLGSMIKRYNAKEAVIVIATPDNADAGVTSNMHIDIYNTDGLRAKHIDNIKITSNPDESSDQLYNRAVSTVYSALQKEERNEVVPISAEIRKFKVRSYFKDINQWKDLRKSLSNISGLSDLSIVSMKRKSAILFFNFNGDEKYLRETLSKSNIQLGEGDTSTAFDIIYDLRFGHSNAGKSDQWYNNQIEPATDNSDSADEAVFTF